MADDWVHIGRVSSVHPLHRKLRIKTEPARAHEFADRTWLTVVPPGAAPMRCRVAAVATFGAVVTVTLAPGVTRDSVGRMKGAAVVLRPEEQTRPPRASDLRQWVGFRVMDPQGQCLGTVSAVYETHTNAAFEVERPNAATLILPAIEAVVKAVDAACGTLVVGDIAPYGVTDEEDKRRAHDEQPAD